MDPIDFLEREELLRFFHRHKTEMSLMENPQTFLNQLRDHNLIPEDHYKKVSRMKSKDNMKKGMYGILDWLEREQSDHIDLFWRCVFKDSILIQYVTLQKLRNSLLDGSFQFEPKLPEKLEETEERKRKEPSEEENGEGNSVKKKRKKKTRSVCDEDDEEQAGPSCQATPTQKKKSKKLCFSSPLKRGEKGNIWTWDIFKVQLPVTCGDKEGLLNRQRLAKGEKCIAVGKRWYTPGEFEKFAGKGSSKNWKLSIRCKETTLGKLIQDGHLKVVNYQRKTKAKKTLFDRVITVSAGENDDDFDEEEQDSSSDRRSSTNPTEEEENAEEQTEEQSDNREGNRTTVFEVTCGDVAATLHKKRFASGTLGKCIRTEKKWMTPVDFVKEVLSEMDASWKKDITCEGKPLSDLIEDKILACHSLLCNCRLCAPDSEDLENQKNDDECWICRSEEEAELVECDYCPRSFHQKCHLPHVEDAILEDDRPWMCTFCVLANTKELFSSMQSTAAALSCNITEHMLQCQYLLLHLYNTDKQQIFATNPSLYLSDYTTVITTPMWFDCVAEKLQEKRYQTVRDFVSDVHLIFTNCASYNRDNPEFTAMGVILKECFDREFKNVFKIHEDTADS